MKYVTALAVRSESSDTYALLLSHDTPQPTPEDIEACLKDNLGEEAEYCDAEAQTTMEISDL